MSGALLATISGASGSQALSSGATEYAIDNGFGVTVLYADGFIGVGSQAAALWPTIGWLAPATALGATVKSLYWYSDGGHGGTGQCIIEFDGTRDAAFLTSVMVNGVSLGTIGSPATVLGITSFNVGGSAVSNPFGSPGTASAINIL